MKASTILWIVGGAAVVWFFVLPLGNPRHHPHVARTGPAVRPRFVGVTVNPRTGEQQQVIAGPTLIRAR